MISGVPPAYLGIDVGGTAIKAAVTDAQAHVLAVFSRGTFSDGTPMGTLHALIAEAVRTARRSGHELRAIGICTPGTVDAVAGVVRFAANLGWTDLSVVDELRQRHRLPISLEHDARAAAEAEAAARDGDTRHDILFVPIGTGVSAALVRDGRVFQGASGGELGHMIVYPEGDGCTCGQRGCVEAYAGGAGLLRRFRRRGGTAPTVADLVASVDRDLVARGVWIEAVDALARGIHGALVLFDPDAIVIGGGLANAGERLLTPLKNRLEDLLTWRSLPQMSLSVLGPSAGLIGAVALALPASPSRAALRTLATELRSHRDHPVDRPV